LRSSSRKWNVKAQNVEKEIGERDGHIGRSQTVERKRLSIAEADDRGSFLARKKGGGGGGFQKKKDFTLLKIYVNGVARVWLRRGETVPKRQGENKEKTHINRQSICRGVSGAAARKLGC